LATTLSEAGRNDEAMTLLMECRSTLAGQSDTRMVLFCTNTTGSVLYRLGRYDEAVATYRTVVAEAERIGDLPLLASAHNNLARSLIELGDFPAAASHLDRAA